MTKLQYISSIRRGREPKFIAPAGKWQCWMCLKSYRQLEIVHETRFDVYLVCQPCKTLTEEAARCQIAIGGRAR